MRHKKFKVFSDSLPIEATDERIAELIEERFDTMDIEEQVFSTRHIKLIQNWQQCSRSCAWNLHKIWKRYYGSDHVQYCEYHNLTRIRS